MPSIGYGGPTQALGIVSGPVGRRSVLLEGGQGYVSRSAAVGVGGRRRVEIGTSLTL